MRNSDTRWQLTAHVANRTCVQQVTVRSSQNTPATLPELKPWSFSTVLPCESNYEDPQTLVPPYSTIVDHTAAWLEAAGARLDRLLWLGTYISFRSYFSVRGGLVVTCYWLWINENEYFNHGTWGPPGLLYNGYRFSFPGINRPESWVGRPSPSSAEVKEKVELYLYYPSGSSWLVPGWTLPFTMIWMLK